MRRVRIPVCKIGDLIPDSGKIVSLGAHGGECALFLHQGRCYAVGSLCPHQNASLAGATCADSTVTCNRHGYRFNLKTGDCLTIGGYGIPTYPVEIQGDVVFVSYWEYD